MKFLDSFKKNYAAKKKEVLTVEEYLKLAAKDPAVYSTAPERMLKAIGVPEVVDTAKDPRLSRIYGNRVIKQYKSFSDFYGMDHVIEAIVSYFKHAAQGLEERNQILYLLGPVGSAKSSLAERLKTLIEQEPIYVLAFSGQEGLDGKLEMSPVFESPLGLFKDVSAEDLGVPKRYVDTRLSPWGVKRLNQAKGDLSQFKVVKCYPSLSEQRALATVVAGDENNQDVTSLVGKGSLRKIEFFEQNDPECYSYSGGLCTANQGLMEFVEMFKANIKTLNPLLTATQEHFYEGVEKIGLMPFEGIILAHSNESEWKKFKDNKDNEAFLDRVYIVEVPYCTRVSEEVKIYQKLLRGSSLSEAPCAPKTLELLAEFCVLSRLDAAGGEVSRVKMKVYDGESMKDKDVNAKSLHEYKAEASRDEGFSGISTRLAFKIISEVYNYDTNEVSADPIHLFTVLKNTIYKERLSKDKATLYGAVIKELLEPEYLKVVTKDVQRAYVDSYEEFGQSSVERYLAFADHWVQDNDYRDPDTGQMYDRAVLNAELEKIEKPAMIANPKDFRNEVVNFALRYKAKEGQNLSWKAYPKLKRVIEANMLNKLEDLLPIISFGGHKSKEDAGKHESFLNRMKEQGYTETQVKRVVDWMMQKQKS